MRSLLTRPLLLHIVLFTFPFFLYLETATYDFAYDDILHIQYSSSVTRDDWSLASFANVFLEATPPGNLYRPLSTISYKLTYLLWGLDPAPFHLTNCILYALCCVLVFHLTMAILSRAEAVPHDEDPVEEDTLIRSNEPVTLKPYFTPAIAFVATLLFAAHPIHVEAVANIIGRAEILTALFGMGSILLLIHALNSSGQGWGIFSLLAGQLLYLLAALSKESGLTFCVLIPLALFYRFRSHPTIPIDQRVKRLVFVSFSLLLLSCVALALRHEALRQRFIMETDYRTIYPENPLFHLPLEERVVHAVRILGDYIVALLAPLHLSADYSLMPEDVLADTFSLPGLLSCIALLSLAYLALCYRRHAFGYFGMWFFIAFALTANLLTPIGTIMGDRLAFTPSIGLLIFIVALLYEFMRSDKMSVRFFGAYTCITFFTFSTLTLLRLPVWRNNAELFEQTLEDAPRSPKALYNYAVHLRTATSDSAEAESYFRRTLEVTPHHILSMGALADIALERKEYWRVEYWYRRILREDPGNKQVQENLAKLLEFKEAFARVEDDQSVEGE